MLFSIPSILFTMIYLYDSPTNYIYAVARNTLLRLVIFLTMLSVVDYHHKHSCSHATLYR